MQDIWKQIISLGRWLLKVQFCIHLFLMYLYKLYKAVLGFCIFPVKRFLNMV